ncbi:MAG TPA: SDR family NAD(P)-dependent oxidoreductase [Solirubrobacteraceae bacterium]|nr:SDR family NAD(P)-dependent oxidoreductase [Solirubrobacteraceae bacterium]
MNAAGRLAGKVALITGAARGMGAAHARAIAREGAKVAIADIAPQDGEQLAAELRSAGGEASYHGLDVTDTVAWREVADVVQRAHGPIDVLVNNAGVQMRSFGIEADDKEWAKVIAVNQQGVFLGMRAVIPSMAENGGGSIINIASVAALVGLPGSLPYQASKSAVLGLTRGAAAAYGRQGIRVNAICPGLIVTAMTESASSEAVETMKAQIPLRREGKPEEISAAVVFLASDESSYITGVALPVDGGFVAV